MYRRLTQKHPLWIVLVVLMTALCACNLGTPSATPVPTPDIPTVEILAPPNNAQVIENTDFPIDIVGRDTTVGVDKIELYVDETLINESVKTDGAVAAYRVTMNWLAKGIGLHVISAIAYREGGLRSDESIINIEVIARNP